ncbi:Imm45 family immunity protein [Sinorhizobium saheli]|uniref:Imm45 family immunity protein n=1 Tax=Sinorhizobium saheli TaxID=36856 RepID=UPI00389AED33
MTKNVLWVLWWPQGYSAGHTFVHLPPEAFVLRTASISVAWLKVNWSTWVYPDCPVEDVLFMERYVL